MKFTLPEKDLMISRTHLFLPDRSPVNVIVPTMPGTGYAGLKIANKLNLFGFVRRNTNSLIKSTRKRFETIVLPVWFTYSFYADFYQGNWQEGLREMFQKRYLYDVLEFDDSLFKRDELGPGLKRLMSCI